MLEIFTMISGIDISYKTVERLYIELAIMAPRNLQVLLLKKKLIKELDATGDCTGYSLTVKNHMRRNLRTKLRRTEMEAMIMASNQQKRKALAYSFMLMNLETKMAFGSSQRRRHFTM